MYRPKTDTTGVIEQRYVSSTYLGWAIVDKDVSALSLNIVNYYL